MFVNIDNFDKCDDAPNTQYTSDNDGFSMYTTPDYDSESLNVCNTYVSSLENTCVKVTNVNDTCYINTITSKVLEKNENNNALYVDLHVDLHVDQQVVVTECDYDEPDNPNKSDNPDKHLCTCKHTNCTKNTNCVRHPDSITQTNIDIGSKSKSEPESTGRIELNPMIDIDMEKFKKSSYYKISTIHDILYIGPYQHPVVNTEEFLQLKIDVIINCCAEITYVPPLNIKIEHYPIYESDIGSFLEHMDTIVESLKKHIIQKQKIYLHCHKGISITPAILTYYLMLVKNKKFDDAVTLIKKRRNVIDIDIEFEDCLRAIEDC